MSPTRAADPSHVPRVWSTVVPMAGFTHLNIRSVLGELSSGVQRKGTAPDLLSQIDALRDLVNDLDSNSAAIRIRRITTQAWSLAGPANRDTSAAAKLIRQSAYRLDDLATVLDSIDDL